MHRRTLDRIAAERTTESYLLSEGDPDWEILHEEIDRLPERLRTPVVLCYLEGLTYDAAARQLGLSEGTLRGRLGRARERLRQRLTSRGVSVPAGLIVAGTAGQSQAQALLPATLVHSTIRIALGFMTGKAAALLARGFLKSMLLNQLKRVAVLLLLGVGSTYGLWHSLASTVDDKGQSRSARPSASRPTPRPGRSPQRRRPHIG